MNNISKYKVDKGIFISILIFTFVSIISIYSAQNLLAKDMQNLYLKQLLWYGIGFALAYFIMFIGSYPKFLVINNVNTACIPNTKPQKIHVFY